MPSGAVRPGPGRGRLEDVIKSPHQPKWQSCYDNALIESFWGRVQTELPTADAGGPGIELANALPAADDRAQQQFHMLTAGPAVVSSPGNASP